MTLENLVGKGALLLSAKELSEYLTTWIQNNQPELMP